MSLAACLAPLATATAPAVIAAGPVDPFEALTAQLHTVAERIDGGHADAGSLLRRLMRQLEASADPRCTGLMVFASALAERLADGSARTANLYLRQFEVPQIELFNLLGQHLPVARMATSIANAVLARAIAGDAHPTLIDIGIGTGRQFVALLGELAAAGTLPAELTVIGIEPAADALAQAQALLETEAARLGVRLHFDGHIAVAEALDDAAWQQIAGRCTGRPAINAAFALHHISDDGQGRCRRDAVLRRLRALEPRCLVLAEPDVDHLEPRFLPRFRNCIAHFGAVFAMLDRLPIRQDDRDALKVGFFGREIVDILATPDALRSERHEAAATWMLRLAASGHALVPAGVPLPDAGGHDGLAVEPRGARLALTADGESLVSVFVAVPRTIA